MSGPMMVVFAVFWMALGAAAAWLVFRAELDAVQAECAELREQAGER